MRRCGDEIRDSFFIGICRMGNPAPQKGSNVKNMVVEWSLKPHILPSITLKHAKEYNR